MTGFHKVSQPSIFVKNRNVGLICEFLLKFRTYKTVMSLQEFTNFQFRNIVLLVRKIYHYEILATF